MKTFLRDVKAGLARDLAGLGINVDKWLDTPEKELKAIDLSVVHALDECGTPELLHAKYPMLASVAGRPNGLFALRTFLNYGYKVEVEPTKKQIEESFQAFLERNGDCRRWYTENLDTVRSVRRGAPQGTHLGLLLQTARVLCVRRVASYKAPGVPRHGPGVSSNCGKGFGLKYESLFRDVPSSCRRFRDYLMPSWRDIKEWQPQGWPPFCTLSAVPKDARGPRLIAPHSTVHMWMQQAIRDKLVSILEAQERWFKYHVLSGQMRSTIQFTDQTPNQALALFASVSPSMYGTADLSDASDRVSLGLCSALLGGTQLWRDLLAVRARWILTDGNRHRLHMHAPMGSAVCFPVMALCLWALVVASILISEDRPYMCETHDVPPVFVFGDDVIFSPTHYAQVVEDLHACGLAVNVKKSFFGPGGFRESCGYDAYRGDVITPLKLHKSEVSSIPDLLSLVAHRNALYASGFTNACSVVEHQIDVRSCELGVRHLIGASTEERYTTSMWFPSSTLAKAWMIKGGTYWKYNRDYQRHEIRCLSLIDSGPKLTADLDSRSRLMEGLLGRSRQGEGLLYAEQRPAVVKQPLWLN